jgi:hypothetical protein
MHGIFCAVNQENTRLFWPRLDCEDTCSSREGGRASIGGMRSRLCCFICILPLSAEHQALLSSRYPLTRNLQYKGAVESISSYVSFDFSLAAALALVGFLRSSS